MKQIMVLGWTYRTRVCTSCKKWSKNAIDVEDLETEAVSILCFACYEEMITPVQLETCEGGSCET